MFVYVYIHAYVHVLRYGVHFREGLESGAGPLCLSPLQRSRLRLSDPASRHDGGIDAMSIT